MSKALEMAARESENHFFVTDADDRWGIGLPDVLDGGGPIRFTSVSLPEALVNLLCISKKRLSVSVYPSLRLKLNTSYTQSDSGVGR